MSGKQKQPPSLSSEHEERKKRKTSHHPSSFHDREDGGKSSLAVRRGVPPLTVAPPPTTTNQNIEESSSSKKISATARRGAEAVSMVTPSSTRTAKPETTPTHSSSTSTTAAATSSQHYPLHYDVGSAPRQIYPGQPPNPYRPQMQQQQPPHPWPITPSPTGMAHNHFMMQWMMAQQQQEQYNWYLQQQLQQQQVSRGTTTQFATATIPQTPQNVQQHVAAATVESGSPPLQGEHQPETVIGEQQQPQPQKRQIHSRKRRTKLPDLHALFSGSKSSDGIDRSGAVFVNMQPHEELNLQQLPSRLQPSQDDPLMATTAQVDEVQRGVVGQEKATTTVSASTPSATRKPKKIRSKRQIDQTRKRR